MLIFISSIFSHVFPLSRYCQSTQNRNCSKLAYDFYGKTSRKISNKVLYDIEACVVCNVEMHFYCNSCKHCRHVRTIFYGKKLRKIARKALQSASVMLSWHIYKILYPIYKAVLLHPLYIVSH